MGHARVSPVVDVTVRELCRRRYLGHPKGCPNYGKRDSCPPEADLIGVVLDLECEVFAVWTRFDLGAHVERMRERHPDWSQRQLVCCLYWQGTARKALTQEINVFLQAQGKRLVVVRCPEACGVDVTATMKSIGVELEWPPVKWVYKIALVGHRGGQAKVPCLFALKGGH